MHTSSEQARQEMERTVRTGVRDARRTVRDQAGAGAAGGAWIPEAIARSRTIVRQLKATGAEADVYVTADKDGDEAIAKVYRYGMEPNLEVLERVKGAGSERLIRILEHGEEASRHWELIEYARHGSLEEHGGAVDARALTTQLNEGLKTLHELGIEHRDLKPGNVLVKSDDPLEIAIADFGISSVVDETVHFTSAARTIGYAPPESVGSTLAGEEGAMVAIARTKWDYWSLGMILVEVLTGKHPFEGLAEATIAYTIATKGADDATTGIEDDGWRELCEGLLERDPAHRWGAEEVEGWLEGRRRTRRHPVRAEQVCEDPNQGLPLDPRREPVRMAGRSFVFTGTGAFGSRAEMQQTTIDAGGMIHSTVRRNTDYIVIGSFVTAAWANERYGRKIEKAVEYRDRLGTGIQIVHEEDWVAGVAMAGALTATGRTRATTDRKRTRPGQ